MTINLRTLLVSPRSELPDWVDAINCIYRIHNLITDKSYIGQAVWFYGRFVANPEWLTHLGGIRYRDSHLYNSIRKHGSRSFEVSIIESNLTDRDELDEREIYWISTSDSFHNGYNMTSGGDRTEHLHTPEAVEKAKATRYERYGSRSGKLKDPDVIEKRLKTNLEYYGSRGGKLVDPEVRRMAREACNEIYGYNGAGQFFTEENWKARCDRYDGDCAGMLHTEEVVRKRQATVASMYNGDICGQLHTKEVRDVASLNMRLTKLFGAIISNLNYLKDNNFEVTPFNYLYESIWVKQRRFRHVSRVFEKYDELKLDPRWTEEMEMIFSHLKLDNYNVVIESDQFD